MATKKDADAGRYRVLRDFALPDGTVASAGGTVTLPDEDAALLIRDGMIAPAEEG